MLALFTRLRRFGVLVPGKIFRIPESFTLDCRFGAWEFCYLDILDSCLCALMAFDLGGVRLKC